MSAIGEHLSNHRKTPITEATLPAKDRLIGWSYQADDVMEVHI